MADMTVTVTMTADDFLEFVAWKKDRKRYIDEMAKKSLKWEILAKKVCWAIEEDAKRPGKVKITDHEHLADLWDMAGEFFDK